MKVLVGIRGSKAERSSQWAKVVLNDSDSDKLQNVAGARNPQPKRLRYKLKAGFRVLAKTGFWPSC